MKCVKTQDAVGHVLCHDITQIIKDVKKGTAFRKGHIVTEEDIPVLLSLGKDNLYIWEKKEGILHENEAAEYLRDIKYQPEQVQDFYPTPGTLSTTMFYTGLDPLTMKPVYVPKSKHEKAMQRALLQYSAPRNYELVHQALVEAGREDLIGMAPRCLIKPREARGYLNRANSNKKGNKKTDNKNHKQRNNSKGGSSKGKNTNERNSKNTSKPKRKRR